MSLFHNIQRTSVVFCTPIPAKAGPDGAPVLETVSANWHRARQQLQIPTNMNTAELRADGMEVGIARSWAAAQCLKMPSNPEFLFFLDYDVLLPPDALSTLLKRARCFPDHDLYAGVYCCKWQQNPEPLIYGEHGQGPIWDWAVGDLLTTASHGVKSCHMGLTLVRVSAFRKILDAQVECGCVRSFESMEDEAWGESYTDWRLYDPANAKGRWALNGCPKCDGAGRVPLVDGDGAGTNPEDSVFFKTVRTFTPEGNRVEGTEDIWFCDLLGKAGGSILVDTGVLAGHEDKNTGRVYGLSMDRHGPVGRARWLPRQDGSREDLAEFAAPPETPCRCLKEAKAESGCLFCGGTGKQLRTKLLALDLGAGSRRREWPDHRTYTTDLRAEAKPDYVQDTRKLTLPDGHFDLVASSHHLEHLGRWDQEGVFREMARITRPGGRWEHVVPNLEWAAHKIVAGELDGHTLNVLYGAQEEHGYRRELNTHFMGFTKALLAALAEAAGMTGVLVRDWNDDPELLYEMVLTCRKPLPGEKPAAPADEGEPSPAEDPGPVPSIPGVSDEPTAPAADPATPDVVEPLQAVVSPETAAAESGRSGWSFPTLSLRGAA